MDINFLLVLQAFRESASGVITTIMEYLSTFAASYLILIPIFIYWCVDKKKGLYTLTTFFVSSAIGSFMRLSLKIHRPWIRDVRVIPAENAEIKAVKSYSFPSYTTSTATSLYGGLAVSAWEKTVTRVLSVICWILVAVTAFSRLYLGVNTIWDVLAGFLLALIVAICLYFLFNFLEKNPDKENFFLFIGIVGAIIWIVNITYMEYPSVFAADGESILINGRDLANEGYFGLGVLAAFCVSRFIEKQWIKFEATGFSLKGIITCLIGLIPVFFMIFAAKAALIESMGGARGNLVYAFILVFYVIAVYPGIIAIVMGTNKKKAPEMKAVFSSSNKSKKRVYTVNTDQK